MSAIKNLIEFRFIQKYPAYRHCRNIKFDIEEIPEDKIDEYIICDYLKRTDNETLYKIEIRDYGRCRFFGDNIYLVDGVCLAYVKNDKVTDIRSLYWF